MHPLDGAYRKLSRGVHHRNETNRRTKAYVKTKPYAMHSEFDANAGEKRWIVDRVIRTPPVGLSNAIGDAIYNFRSALDHLAYQLVVANGNVPTRQTAFVLADSPGLWNRVWKQRTHGMSDPAIALIRSCQPCFETHHYRALWGSQLEALSNIDKHRHLYLTLAATTGGLFSQTIPFGSKWYVHQGPINENAPTVMATIETKTDTDMEYGFFGDVTFGDPGPACNEAVYPALMSFGVFVEGLLNDFGAKFFSSPLPSWRRTRRPGSV
jgi:hypothetical protein